MIKERQRAQLSENGLAILNNTEPGKRSEDEVALLCRWIKTFMYRAVKEVPQEKLEILCNFIEKRMISRGDPVFLQGELGSHFYFVFQGSVHVYAEKNHQVAMQRLREIKEVGNSVHIDLLSGMLGQHIKTYGANDGFGELSLSGPNPMRNGE